MKLYAVIDTNVLVSALLRWDLENGGRPILEAEGDNHE